MFPRLLGHQELEGEFAHPLEKLDKKWVYWRVGDYREKVEECDEHCVTNHPGQTLRAFLSIVIFK